MTTLVSLLHIHLYQTITTAHQTSPSKSTIKFAHQTKPSKRQTIKNFDYPFLSERKVLPFRQKTLRVDRTVADYVKVRNNLEKSE